MTNFVITRRFWPLFGANTLGAFADNALRQSTINAVYAAALAGVAAKDFTLPLGAGIYAGSLVSMGFTIPILIFSVISGQLADRVDRHILVRYLKVTELGLMAFAALCFALGNALLLILALFLMGTQSAFFSPVRNALMPDYYRTEDLPKANGYFNAGLFVAVVLGLGMGGYFVAVEGGRIIVSTILIAGAGAGALLAFATPKAPVSGEHKINWNIPLVAVRLYQDTARLPGLIYPMLGIGWYWMVGATLLALLPNFVGETLGGGEIEITIALVVSALGAGAGSILAGLVSARVKDSLVLSGIGVSGTVIASLLIFLIAQGYEMPEAGFMSLANAPLLLTIIFFAGANGLYVVPLMALLQDRAPNDRRARIMGASNMTNGGLATIGAALLIPLQALGMTPDLIFLLIGGLQANLVVFMWRRRRAIRAHANPLTKEVISPAFTKEND